MAEDADAPTLSVPALPVVAFRAAFLAAPTPMVLTDLDGRVLEANDAVGRQVARPALREVPDLVGTLVPLPDLDGLDVPGATWTGWLHDWAGHVRLWCEAQVLPTPLGPPGWLLLRLDLTATPEHQRDPLTGLVGKAVLVERLTHALASRRVGSVGLMVVDVDDFKSVNDSWGHQAGDEVLVEVAARLGACVRPEDTVCRWGGDEFIVLVDDANEHVGSVLQRRLREALTLPVSVSGRSVPVSASCGWVESGRGSVGADLLHQADQRMYAMKNRRRGHGQGAEESEAEARSGRAQAQARSLSADAQSAQERSRRTLSESLEIRERVRATWEDQMSRLRDRG